MQNQKITNKFINSLPPSRHSQEQLHGHTSWRIPAGAISPSVYPLAGKMCACKPTATLASEDWHIPNPEHQPSAPRSGSRARKTWFHLASEQSSYQANLSCLAFSLWTLVWQTFQMKLVCSPNFASRLSCSAHCLSNLMDGSYHSNRFFETSSQGLALQKQAKEALQAKEAPWHTKEDRSGMWR